eukprot:GHVU01143492.1.p1 GENE.GHVU01143492.1~~GHVU01143492.1.p1  ORF type:complete len:176 (+),score=15.94 GHVU01143492.1:151-678(+)
MCDFKSCCGNKGRCFCFAMNFCGLVDGIIWTLLGVYLVSAGSAKWPQGPYLITSGVIFFSAGIMGMVASLCTMTLLALISVCGYIGCGVAGAIFGMTQFGLWYQEYRKDAAGVEHPHEMWWMVMNLMVPLLTALSLILVADNMNSIYNIRRQGGKGWEKARASEIKLANQCASKA